MILKFFLIEKMDEPMRGLETRIKFQHTTLMNRCLARELGAAKVVQTKPRTRSEYRSQVVFVIPFVHLSRYHHAVLIFIDRLPYFTTGYALYRTIQSYDYFFMNCQRFS
jgi:hypothetical protein